MTGINKSFNPFIYEGTKRKMSFTPGDKIIADAKETKNTDFKTENNLVGQGSWTAQQIKDSGLEAPGRYFIIVYTDYYRFNRDNISADFPGKSILTLDDLKREVETKETDDEHGTVGTSSWSWEEIQREGIDFAEYGEYFIAVYTNFYRFNPETVMRDFPGKSIQTLSDLKSAIDSLSEDNPVSDDPLLIQGYLETYRDRLLYMTSDNNVYTSILNSMQAEIVSYCQQNGTDGLNSYMDEIFDNLLRKVVHQSILEVKENLVNEYGYNEEYANVIREFLEQKINVNPKDDEFNLDNIKREINDIINTLTGETQLEGYNYNNEQHVFKMDSLLTEEYTSLSIQNEFFAFMITNSCNFEDDRDRDTFLRRIFTDASESIGKWTTTYLNSFTLQENDTHIKISDLIALDKNSDNSWLSEFYEIISANASPVNSTANYKNAVNIDPDLLFGDKDALTPEDITQMLDDMMFSGDEGIVKFRKMIYQALDRFNIDNYYDETELITDIIKMLNDKSGASNEKPVKITKESLYKLNDGTLFEALEDIVTGDELLNRYYFDVDDELDLYSEARESGACWAIAALSSLAASPVGAQMIKDAMTFNDDGSVTVTFKGANNRSYIITKEEMKYAKEHSDGVSYGDNTMLVLLLATEKLRKELMYSGNTIMSNLSPDDPGYWIYGGTQQRMTEWLTGKSELDTSISYTDFSQELDDDTKAYLLYLGRTKYNTNNLSYVIRKILEEKYGTCFSKSQIFEILKPGIMSGDVVLHLTTFAGTYTFPTQPDGETKTIYSGNHAWAVKEVTEDTITFWDLYRQEEYTVYTQDLINCGFDFRYTVLSDDYELSKILYPNFTAIVLDFKNNENIQRDKSTFDNVIVEGTSMTIEEILNSENSPVINFDDISGIVYDHLMESSDSDEHREGAVYRIMEVIGVYIKQIYAHMPNYTDYTALNNAYNQTVEYFASITSNVLDKCTEYIRHGLPLEAAFEICGFHPDIKTVFEKFLSFLPEGSETSDESDPDNEWLLF